MFYLHVSNKTENLLQHLSELLRVDSGRSFFEPELFLIQSQGMERMICQNMAASFGAFCNFSFFSPLSLLDYIADRLGVDSSGQRFERSSLSWRLELLLRQLDVDALEPLQYYLSGEGAELKRFQLARRLAHLFDQYQIMRPEMLQAWQTGRLVSTDPSELWQRHLWLGLLEQGDGNHRGQVFGQLIEKIRDTELIKEDLPRRISVFGLHTLPPIYLDFLNSLASVVDVHFFLLSPCLNYWGNIQSRRRQARQNGLLEDIESEHHPLLAVLGSQGRDMQNLLLERADFGLEFTSYEEPDGQESDYTLLHRIQADLLAGEIRPAVQETIADDSVIVVSCHSRLRELMVVKDRILHWLECEPELELKDIVVMAPDIQEYSVLIPAIFEKIQHSIADRSLCRKNSMLGAFLQFMDLFTSRFGWSEVLDLLRQPTIYPQFGLGGGDLDTISQWVVDSGIRWGLSGEQRETIAGFSFSESSWRAGLDRMLMGYAVGEEAFVDGILPYPEIEGKNATILGALCRFIDVLERAETEFSKLRPLAEWSTILEHYVAWLFGPSVENETFELHNLLGELAGDLATLHRGEIDFVVIRDWLTGSAGESRSSSGFLRGQLTFCSMLPMRSIPFGKVCLLGLNEGDYPRRDRHETFDLMAGTFRSGDRSARGDDRYQFLEAILSTRSSLYLSYIGQSVRTNEALSPSVVVSEFLEVLEKNYGVKNLTTAHPLHPFSRKYFDGSSRELFSYDSYYAQTAQTIAAVKKDSFVWWEGALDHEIEEIHLDELFAFFNHPQRFFIRNVLGMEVRSFTQQPKESEVFQMSGLDNYYLTREMLDEIENTNLQDDFLRGVQVRGVWPLGRPGQQLFESRFSEVAEFWHLIQAQGMGALLPEVAVDCYVGKYRLHGRLGDLHENGFLITRPGKLRGVQLLRGMLIQEILAVLGQKMEGVIAATDRLVRFPKGRSLFGLERLLELFERGCRCPSWLFPEPAFQYALQELNHRAKVSPLEKAIKTFEQSLEKGYEPEWEILYSQGIDDGWHEFETLCKEFICPVVGSINDERLS